MKESQHKMTSPNTTNR